MSKPEEWADEIMNSLEGIQRAKPRADLFDAIDAKIDALPQPKVIPIRRLAWVAAAACVVIFVNIYSLTSSTNTEIAEEQGTETPLLSDYSIY